VPLSGVVHLTVHAPFRESGPQPLLYLVPQDRPLVTVTQVQVTDIDQDPSGPGT
jgi:hypothetical protein